MSKMLRFLFVFSLAAVFTGLIGTQSAAQTLVEYQLNGITWDGSPLNPASVNGETSATPITITGPAEYDTDFWGGSQHNMFLVNWSSALNMSQNYFEFTVSAEDGKLLDLDEVRMGVATEAASGDFQGPVTYRLYSSITGFGPTDHIAEETNLSTGGIVQRTLSASLGGPFSGIEEVTFRVYGFQEVGSAMAAGGLANFPEGDYPYQGFDFNVQGAGSNVVVTGSVFEPDELTISTVLVTGIQPNQATFSSAIPADGGETITGRGFVYSLTSLNETPEIGGTNVIQVSSGAGTGSFSETVTGLNSVTQYSVRAYATTASGTTYTAVQTFVTPGPELLRYSISTLSGYDLSPINASNTAANIGSQPLTFDTTDLAVDTDFWEPVEEAVFLVGWQNNLDMGKNYAEFTISADPGFELNLATISIGVGREATASLSGPQTFRLYADVTGFGPNDFITELVLPVAAGGIRQQTLSAVLDENFSGIESATFRLYGYGDVQIGSEGQIPGGGLANFSGDVSLGGFNFVVRGVGSDVIVTGTAVGPPEVEVIAASDITSTSALLGGEVLADGGGAVLQRGIVWGRDENPTIEDDVVVEMSSASASFSEMVSFLPFGTTIHYRAFASNSNGTGYSENLQFQTGSDLALELTGQPGWRLISVPAGVMLSEFLSPIWTQGAVGSDYEPGPANVYRWPDAEGDDASSWVPVTNLNVSAGAGEGLLIFVFQDDDYAAGGGTFPKLLPLSGSEFQPIANAAINSNASGLTLLGNPFGSSLQFDEFFGNSSEITGTVYVWDPNDNTGDGGTGGASSGSWKTYSAGLGAGDLTDGIIAPFQGFFIQNTGTGGGSSSAGFLQDMKGTGGEFLGRPAQDYMVRLQLSGNGMRDSAWLVFNSEGSEARTNSDGLQLAPLSADHLVAAVKKADDSLYDIAHLPDLYSSFSIPLALQTTVTGTYSVDFSNINLPDNMPLYFADTETGEAIRISENTTYEFTLHADERTEHEANPLQKIGDASAAVQAEAEATRFIITADPAEFTNTETTENPLRLHLYQNYPNPFNPVTQIRYDLPESGDVRLEVYNIQGQRVATLVNSTQAAGTHTVQFNGSSLSSGLYLYRLQTGSQSLSGKMMLVK